MCNTLNIILITLIVYSFIGTIAYVVTGENDDVLFAFGLGIFGLAILFIIRLLNKINKYLRHSKLCSVYKDVETGKLYKCKVKHSKNMDWMRKYEIVKRYGKRDEYENVPWISNDVIKESEINCDNCIYNNVCDTYGSEIKCKHTEFGEVIVFDKFERK